MQGNAEISGNAVSYDLTSGGGGGGVNLDEGGVFTMKSGGIKSNNVGSGVRIHKGTFNMEGGEISGNSSSFSGGGVSVAAGGGTFIKTGGVIYGSNESVESLKNSVPFGSSGHAVWVGSGKKRDNTAAETVTLDSTKTGTAGGWD